MKIAIPLHQEVLSMHFGHCEKFALIEVNEQSKEILSTNYQQPPAHEPGLLPRWLGELGVNLIIAGGMGSRAQELFASNNIAVLVGAQGISADELVSAYLNSTLQTGENCCDH